jgi:hypothetical protein
MGNKFINMQLTTRTLLAGVYTICIAKSALVNKLLWNADNAHRSENRGVRARRCKLVLMYYLFSRALTPFCAQHIASYYW